MNSKKMLLYLMTFLIIFSSVIHPSVLIAETVDDDTDIEAGSLDFSVQTVEEEPEEETENTPEVQSGEQSGNDNPTTEEDGAGENTVTPDPPDEAVEPPVKEEPAVEQPAEEEPVIEEPNGAEGPAEEELNTDEEEPETGMGILNVTGGPGVYTPDSGSLSLNVTLDGVSTNTHTRPNMDTKWISAYCS